MPFMGRLHDSGALAIGEGGNTGREVLSSLECLPCMIRCLQNSITVVETGDARLVPFVAQFGASTTVVDEPVAHLCHADSRGLQFLLISSGFWWLLDVTLTLEKSAFCSSDG